MPKANKKATPKIIHVGMLSAFMPVYGYYSSYCYEKGFCKQFGIPHSFIEISLSDVLKTIGILIPIILLFYAGAEILFQARASKNPIIRGLGRIFWIIFAFIVILMFVGWDKIIFYAFLTVLGIEVFIEFIKPLFAGFKGYKKKLESQQVENEKDVLLFDAILTEVIERIGGITSLIMFFLIFSLLLVGPVGEKHARNQKSFLVIESAPELIILRKYDQNFICSPFDRKKKEIKQTFYIKSVDQIGQQGLQVVVEDIGPLKVSKKEINNEVKKIKEN